MGLDNMAIKLRKCEKCSRHLINRGFGYYYHPLVQDHFGRDKSDEYQCSIALDPLANTFKISEPVELLPEEIALNLSILSY